MKATIKITAPSTGVTVTHETTTGTCIFDPRFIPFDVWERAANAEGLPGDLAPSVGCGPKGIQYEATGIDGLFVQRGMVNLCRGVKTGPNSADYTRHPNVEFPIEITTDYRS